MINRYYISCATCEHKHTLRITLGTDNVQEHSFECFECGEQVVVHLELNFEERVVFKEAPMFSAPTVTFKCAENCEISEGEGTIVNLDPLFLISKDMRHEDMVFPWMKEAARIGPIDSEREPTPLPFLNDIISEIGGERNLKKKLLALKKARDLHLRGQDSLAVIKLDEFSSYFQCERKSLEESMLMGAMSILGKSAESDLAKIMDEQSIIKQKNMNEYFRLRSDYLSKWELSSFDEFFDIIKDYLQSYGELSQTLIYARRNIDIESDLESSSKDFRKVKMFYGNCFEVLTGSYFLPACLNNIKQGRPYDTFLEMDLKKYMTINKANRANPFKDNLSYLSIYSELDSTIRNASHHGGMRLSSNSPNVIEYRSGNTGGWKRMKYADYLLHCNRIFLCTVKTMFLHMAFKLELEFEEC